MEDGARYQAPDLLVFLPRLDSSKMQSKPPCLQRCVATKWHQFVQLERPYHSTHLAWPVVFQVGANALHLEPPAHGTCAAHRPAKSAG